jgi:O-antigen/teichoic acid export membrane protein
MSPAPLPGPSQSRQRFTALAAASSWSFVARVASIANLVLAVPFALEALGTARFGAWATATAFLFLANFMDLGLGNGTMNLVASAHGRNNPEEATSYLREGTRALVQVGAGFALLLMVLVPFVPWRLVLGLPAGHEDEALATAVIVGLGMAMSAPLGLAGRVQLGRSQGPRTYRWQAAGHLLSLTLVIVFSINRLGLPAITFAAILGPLLASGANSVLLWREMHALPKPPPQDARALRARIRRDGLTFFVVQVAAALALAGDVPMIAAIQGAEAAAPYALAQRVYSVIPIALGLVLAPLWPIYRQALAAGDFQWAAATLRTTLLAGGTLALLAATAITLGFNQIIALWVGPAVAPPLLLAAGLGLWCVLESIGASMSTFLNAAGIMRIQVYTAALFAAGCLSAKVLALQEYDAWVLPWITCALYLVTTIVPTMAARRRLMRTAASKSY